MKPKFKDIAAWEQAQLLMQPAFIRVVDNIRQQLEVSPWQGTYEEVQDPYPGYKLCLKAGERTVKVDIWELCFQVCFRDYFPAGEAGEVQVEIDTSLIDEVGAVDWQELENKTRSLIGQVFANLSSDICQS